MSGATCGSNVFGDLPERWLFFEEGYCATPASKPALPLRPKPGPGPTAGGLDDLDTRSSRSVVAKRRRVRIEHCELHGPPENLPRVRH